MTFTRVDTSGPGARSEPKTWPEPVYYGELSGTGVCMGPDDPVCVVWRDRKSLLFLIFVDRQVRDFIYAEGVTIPDGTILSRPIEAVSMSNDCAGGTRSSHVGDHRIQPMWNPLASNEA